MDYRTRISGWIMVVAMAGGGVAVGQDVSDLDQHFNAPGKDIAPWMFVPQENIKEFSTTEHPGLATIFEAGKGKDIKGILKDPIKIGQYRLPWEFQTSLVQSFNLTAGVGVKTQVNSAIGLNVAVTFSDPTTWPADRTQRPKQTHEFQLLVVHLGSTGEAGVGLPQFSSEPHPETYLVWGRGDLGHTAMGDWRIPYVWIGDGAKYGGPASPQLYFRCVLLSPTQLQVGIKFDAAHGWNMRTIDCSEYGRITGVWEIGPIISADRWIPDVLCRHLPQVKGPHPLFLGDAAPDTGHGKMTPVRSPRPEAPNPKYEYYVDYCVFFGSSPRPFAKFSDEFDIPGYLGRWQIQSQCTLADTHSHPGYLMLKLIGPGLGTGFGAAGGSSLRLSDYRPPWEIETSFIPPDDSTPWNYWMNFILLDEQGKRLGMWTPGVENDAKARRHSVFDIGALKVRFEPPVPESVLASKPLAMLIQCLDESHVRLGFRGKPTDPWTLSEICDVKKAVGSEVGAFGMHCWSTTTGRMFGARPGTPMYQKFLVDYVRYRYGLSAGAEQKEIPPSPAKPKTPAKPKPVALEPGAPKTDAAKRVAPKAVAPKAAALKPIALKPVVLKESYQVLQRDAADRASCIAVLPAGVDPAARLVVEVEAKSGTSQAKAERVELEGKAAGVSIPDLAVGGPYTIRIVDGNRPGKPLLEFENILVGDIWLLGGQSNMFGADVVKEKLPAIPGINMLDVRHFDKDAHWCAAVPPIHRIPEPFATFTLKSQQPGISEQRIRDILGSKTPVGGIDGSYFFARELFAESKVPIGLIPCATGGSLSIWDPSQRDKNRYGFLLHHVRSVGARVKGLLFYQGEQDAIFGDDDATVTKPSLIGPLKTYGQRFASFVQELREDVGDPKMPVIFAQICRHHNGPEGRGKSWELIRETQRTIPDHLSVAHCLPTIDLEVMDGLHLDYESQRRMGSRMAYLALPYVKPGVRPRAEIRLKSATVGNTPRPTIVVEFSGVTGKLQAAGRPAGFVLKHKTTGQPVDWIYKTEFDAARRNIVILHSTGAPKEDWALYYGAGAAPYVNIVDDNDMPLPAFGPTMISATGT